MSSGRSRVPKKITEEEINDLISRLQALVPERRTESLSRASASVVLKETCNYIRRLHRELDSLNEQLAHLLENMDSSGAEAEIIKNLLM
ncbi:transcription factor ILI6-like [Magnolia sinica]|uniref:transcription factor ILI6-like n=1 Tax=Magnolia sinica TaxID=86752 RepID=UPI00265905BC|nr:transcription factor ILI6-like [Magnolia sinica]